MELHALLEEELEGIFGLLYDMLIRNEHLAQFFTSKEQLLSLVTRQRASLLDSLKETPENFEARYHRLGQMHYNLGLPLFDYVSAQQFIRDTLYDRLSERGELNVHYPELRTLFKRMINITSRAYFYLEIEHEVERYDAELNNALFYRLLVKESKEFLEAILKGDKQARERLNNSDFTAWFESGSTTIIVRDSRARARINELYTEYLVTASSIINHVGSGFFYEAYSLLHHFSGISVRLMHRLNQEVVRHYSNKEEAFFNYLHPNEDIPVLGHLAVIDVRKMKQINKYRGVETGDRVIEEMEKGIKSFAVALSDEIVYTRAGTGEFFIYFPEEFSRGELEAIYVQFQHLLENFTIETPANTLTVKVAVGVLPLGEVMNIKTLQRLLRYTLNRARDTDRNRWFVAEDEKREALELIRKSEKDVHFVHDALHGDKLEIFFQPIIDLETDAIYDVEVLARIRQGESCLPAGAFIDLIYELDVIVELDIGILNRVLEYAERIKSVTDNVFINVAPHSLRSRHYIATLHHALGELRSKGLEVVFELTEQTFLDNIDLLTNLSAEEGIRFAVDDFGTGFSSLGTVAELAEEGVIDYIKIDGSIVKNIISSEKTYQILDATSYMTRKLGLKNIAEYIENEEVLERVKSLLEPVHAA